MYLKLRNSVRDYESLIFTVLCIITAWTRPQESKDNQFSSVAQSCPTLCDTMDCSMPGLPVHHPLLELAQTHVH